MKNIELIWSRLVSLQGEEFRTKTQLPFTYEITGNIFNPSRTKYNISKADFEKALTKVPFGGPGEVNRDVRGPTYIWAVLHDERVRGNDW